MPGRCADCGAVFNDDNSCQTIFNSCLALEFVDPDYGEVHFLTVSCFMIQHGRYSDGALIWIEQKLRTNLEEGIPADQIRRLVAKEISLSKHTMKINRPKDATPLSKIKWSMTIADVARNYQDAGSYCDLVKKWARATMVEMHPLLRMF